MQIVIIRPLAMYHLFLDGALSDLDLDGRGYHGSGNGIDLKIQTNMFAYDCPQPIAPSEMAEGEIYECEEKDREELAEFAEMFHDETGVDRMDKEGYLKYAEEKIADGRTFFWKDAHLANRNTKENTLSY